MQHSLRILTYNVRYFGHALKGLASTLPAMRRIAEAIATLDPLPAIVCLQEIETRSIRSTVAHPGDDTQLERFMVLLSRALDDRGRSHRYQAHYFRAHSYRLSQQTHVYTTGLAVLARDDFVVDHHNADSPHDITHRSLHAIRRLKQTRICAHVRIRSTSAVFAEPIDVFNTHLSLPSAFAREFWTERRRLGWGRNQLQEARSLARFVERERSSDRFLVLGDFNALPGSPVYNFLVHEQGWVDGFAQRYGMSTEELVMWPTAGFMRMRMHLDHVFAGRALSWLDFDGSYAFGDRAAPFHGLSDHVPMVARCHVARSSAKPPRGSGANARSLR